MAQLFGGMGGGLLGSDLLDPAKFDDFARRLEQLEGWTSVRHRGDGVFDVVYETTGRLDQNYAWPMLPNSQAILPFVQVIREKGGRLRVSAPGFASNEKASALAAVQMMGALAAKGSDSDAPEMPPRTGPKGTFTLTTDGEILTNNTREGPARAGERRTLSWDVGGLDEVLPEALLGL